MPGHVMLRAEVPPSIASSTHLPHLFVFLVVLGGVLGFSSVAWSEPAERSPDSLQRVLDSLRARLAIPQTVLVSIVDANPKIVSVAPASAVRPFTVEIESSFVASLSDEELAAALAHELGHVWVSTHHPFLQTERLANDVAMRVVTRESLARVYRKMWARIGTSADMADYLGPELLRVTRRYAAN